MEKMTEEAIAKINSFTVNIKESMNTLIEQTKKQ